MIDDLLNEYLPVGWRLTCLTYLDPEWQAIICDDEHVSIATGESIENALANASLKVFNGDFIGRLFHLKYERVELKSKLNLQALGLVKPIERRI